MIPREDHPKRGCISLSFFWIAFVFALGTLYAATFALSTEYEYLMEPLLQLNAYEDKISSITDPKSLADAMEHSTSARQHVRKGTFHLSVGFVRLFSAICVSLVFSLFAMSKSYRASAWNTRAALTLAVGGFLIFWGVRIWSSHTAIDTGYPQDLTEEAQWENFAELKLEAYENAKILHYSMRISAFSKIIIIGYCATLLFFLARSIFPRSRNRHVPTENSHW